MATRQYFPVSFDLSSFSITKKSVVFPSFSIFLAKQNKPFFLITFLSSVGMTTGQQLILSL